MAKSKVVANKAVKAKVWKGYGWGIWRGRGWEHRGRNTWPYVIRQRAVGDVSAWVRVLVTVSPVRKGR